MYAVIDTETTGLSPALRHRIVEVAVVLVDEEGVVEDTWVTLLNPERDLGAQRIHGIRAAEVLDAPKFADVAGHLADMLAGRVLVAHNVRFDLGFIDAEFDRLGVPFPLTLEGGLCTMALARTYLEGAGRSLRECCAAAGVRLEGWHSALADAIASAGLLAHYMAVCGRPVPWAAVKRSASEALWPTVDRHVFTPVTRSVAVDAGSGPHSPLLASLIDFMPRVDSSELADPYLAVLDQALSDRYLSADEDAALTVLAESLGLTPADVSALHRDYLNALARVALSDHRLSEDETADLVLVAEILRLPVGAVPSALEKASRTQIFHPSADGRLPLERGDLIVFTGDMDEPRELWMQRAAEHGYVPHPNVTKKVRLVVAADPDSLSGKARKARGYAIPIIGVDEFRSALGYAPPEAGQLRDTANWSDTEREWAQLLRKEMDS